MEEQIRKVIEQGIREHLVITNEPGVKYAVDKIMKLLPIEQIATDGWEAAGDYQSVPGSPNYEKWITTYKKSH